jgi:quercetin dioxygenase-like cupin family protein
VTLSYLLVIVQTATGRRHRTVTPGRLNESAPSTRLPESREAVHQMLRGEYQLSEARDAPGDGLQFTKNRSLGIGLGRLLVNLQEAPTTRNMCRDRGLQIMRWARDLVAVNGEQVLEVDLGVRPVPVAHSNATGQPLVSNGQLGVDVIRLSAGEGAVPHTHPGNHLLIVVGGQGTITYGGKIYPTRAGEVCLVDGHVPHAIGAITNHVILAVDSPHTPVDSPGRMKPASYQAVTASIDDLHCLICDARAIYPTLLHELGCQHCPCLECNPGSDIHPHGHPANGHSPS